MMVTILLTIDIQVETEEQIVITDVSVVSSPCLASHRTLSDAAVVTRNVMCGNMESTKLTHGRTRPECPTVANEWFCKV